MEQRVRSAFLRDEPRKSSIGRCVRHVEEITRQKLAPIPAGEHVERTSSNRLSAVPVDLE